MKETFSVRPVLFFLTATTLLFASPTALAKGKSGKVSKSSTSSSLKEPQTDYDRLDGKGLTKKHVEVIEWEGNLEIHVAPKGSLKSLGLKVDRENKDHPVMVVEYQFNGVPYTLVRRAVLSIKISDQFKVFRDPSENDYDKIMISNNTLDPSVVPFTAVHEPRQTYPDGYGEDAATLADSSDDTDNSGSDGPTSSAAAAPSSAPAAAAVSANRKPSAQAIEREARAKTYDGFNSNARNVPGVKMQEEKKKPANVDEDGNIREFSF